MRTIQLWICIFLIFTASHSNAQTTVSLNTRSDHHDHAVAVLDFVMVPGELDQANNWAVGLADFLSAILRENGVPLLERADLGYALSERRLRKNIGRSEETIRQKLPWVTFLLKGEVRKQNDTQFQLLISVVRTTDGTLSTEFEATGTYPQDIAPALNELGKKVAHLTAIPLLEHPSREPIPGFTKAPEIAMLFYKGVDYFVRGHPELAEEYFRLANERDVSFVTAAIWRIKAYQRLGLDDFAGLVRRELEQDSATADLLNHIVSELARVKSKWVVSLSTPDRDVSPRFVETLREALFKHPEITVISTEWVKNLAAEMDLSIGGEFEPHVLLRRVWLPVDYVILVTGKSGVDELKIEILDAASGEILREISISPSSADGAQTCQRIILDLPADTGSRPAESGRTTRHLAPLDYEPLKTYEFHKYDLPSYAYHLREFADNPCDPIKLMNAYGWIRAQLPGMYNEWPSRSWPYIQLMMDRLLSCIRSDDPEAPNWMSHALWSKWQMGTWYMGGHATPPNEPLMSAKLTFAPLLDRYPDSFAAFCARYAIAIEHMVAERHDPAAARFEELGRYADRFKDQQSLRWRFQLYYYAAHELLALRRTEAAKPYIQQAYEAIMSEELRGQNESLEEEINRRISSVSGLTLYGLTWNPELSKTKTWHTDEFIPFPSWRDRTLNYLLIGKELLRLHSEFFGSINPSIGESQLDTLQHRYQAVAHLKRQDRYGATKKYIEEIIRQARMNVELPQQHGSMVEILAKELLQSAGNSSLDEAGRLVNELADTLRDTRRTNKVPDYLVVNVFVLHEHYAGLLQWADELIGSTDANQRHLGIIVKEQVLTRRGQHRENARFLEKELLRFEKDFDSGSSYHVIDIAYQAAAAFRKSGELSEAAGIYRHAIKWIEEKKSDNDYLLSARASLYFHLAELEGMNNNLPTAVELLKKVVDLSEAKDWRLVVEGAENYFDTGTRLRGATPPVLYARAVRELDVLRRAAASKPATDSGNVAVGTLFASGLNTGGSGILDFRVVEEYSDRLVLDVDYEYSGDQGEIEYIRVRSANSWESDIGFGQTKVSMVHVGRGTARLSIRNFEQPEPLTTRYLDFCISTSSYELSRRRFMYQKTWSWSTVSPTLQQAASKPGATAANKIISFKVYRERPDQLILDVECEYSGDTTFLAAYFAVDGTILNTYAVIPGLVKEGHGTTRVKLSAQRGKEPLHTNQLCFTFRNQTGTFYRRFFEYHKVWTWPEKNIVLGSQPTERLPCTGLSAPSTPTDTGQNDIFGFCVVEEKRDKLVLDVDCQYASNAKGLACVRVYPAEDGIRGFGWAYKPGNAEPGRQIVRVTLTMDGTRPTFTSNQILITLDGCGKPDPLLEKYFDFDKTWSREQ